jgi:hypothetical protein
MGGRIMAAVPIYVWNGSAWQEIGPTIPASPIAYQASAPASPSTGDVWVDSDGDVTTGSQQFQRFRFVASGGETTISGADADGAVLAYTAGLEQVILNGAVLVRGQDYTATDGTNITGLSPALVASDVLEVFSFIAFTVANTYTQSQVDGLVATATAEPGMKLIVPSSAVNGTVSATGAVSFTGVSSVSLNNCFSSTYNNYLIVPDNITQSTSSYMLFRLRTSGTDNTDNSYWRQYILANSGTVSAARNQATSLDFWEAGATFPASGQMDIQNPFATAYTRANYFVNQENPTTQGFIQGAFTFNGTTSFDGFTLIAASGTITGTIRVYGYKN